MSIYAVFERRLAIAENQKYIFIHFSVNLTTKCNAVRVVRERSQTPNRMHAFHLSGQLVSQTTKFILCVRTHLCVLFIVVVVVWPNVC